MQAVNRILVVFLVFFALCSTGYSQVSAKANETKQKGYKVEILSAKSLKAGKTKNHQKLVGDVVLRQGAVRLFCDSAEINQLNNDFEAWGKVFINKEDSVKAWGDSLKYQGKEEKAKLIGNAKLVQGKTTLRTDVLFMDQKNDLFYYLTPAVIHSEESVITSDKGYYYNSSGKITFKDSVKVKHPDYTILADTLDYYTANEKVVFQGPTYIYFEKEQIYCERGFYNSANKNAEFRQNAAIESEENTLYADSIVADQNKEFSEAFYHVEIIDTANKINIKGHYGYFDQQNNSSFVADSALFVQYLDGDTLYMHGDTIRALEDSLQQKSFFVYYGTRMFKKDMQAVCDSLTYSFKDSLIQLFYNPIVWSGANQLTGDSISILSYDNKIKEMYIKGNSLIVSETDTVHEFYDQIKGRKMTGYFKDGKMDVMDVDGNGQTLYYAKEEDGKYTGVNKAECSKIKIRFQKNEIQKILFLQMPVATFFPLVDFPADESKLKGFVWLHEYRPKKASDVFKKEEIKKK